MKKKQTVQTKDSQTSTKPSVIDTLKMLCSVCREPPTADGLKVYAQMIADVDGDALRAGAERYLNESEEPWFPSVGKLRRLAAEAADGAVPGWEVAWARILEGLRMSDRFDRARAQAAREHVGPVLMNFVKMLGGWEVIGMAKPDVIASNFRNAWESQRTNNATQRALPEHLRPKTALIGEQQHARIE